MNITFELIVPAVLVIAVLVATLIFVRRISRRNTVVTVDEHRFEWKDLRCPDCKNPMEQGWSMAGRGIIWREKNEKKPGTFSTLGSTLKNTLHMGFQPALNASWRCRTCSMVVLDHSRLIRLGKQT